MDKNSQIIGDAYQVAFFWSHLTMDIKDLASSANTFCM